MKTKLSLLTTLFMVLFAGFLNMESYATIEGKITDKVTRNPIDFA